MVAKLGYPTDKVLVPRNQKVYNGGCTSATVCKRCNTPLAHMFAQSVTSPLSHYFYQSSVIGCPIVQAEVCRYAEWSE